jgi:hypothetical protein
MYSRECCGGDLGRRVRPRALRGRNKGSQDDLPRRVIGQEVETTLESDVAERFVARGVENALRPGPSEASNPRQRSKQRDLVCRDRTDCLVRPIRRRFDRRLVKLAELTDGNDLVKSADGRPDYAVGCGPRQRRGDAYGGGQPGAKRPAPRTQLDSLSRPDDGQRGDGGDQAECVEKERQQSAILRAR